MALFEWTSRYETGIRTIDEQHRGIVDLINTLHAAREEGQGSGSTLTVLQGLIEYANVHFALEERAMLEFDFAGYTEHRAEHTEFVARVGDFSADLNEEAPRLTEDLLYFVRDWLIEHVLGTDMKYVACFREHGFDGDDEKPVQI